MITANQTIIDNLNAPVRRITAKAELYNGSALVDTFAHSDRLKSASIDRIGEDSKFFGFGICQKANIKLIDRDREIDISTANNFVLSFDDVVAFPKLYVTEVNRDETTNELSITAYDALHKAVAHFSNEVVIEAPYTLQAYAEACGAVLGLEVVVPPLMMFEYLYADGANIEGTESIRDMLDDIAEATQTIYFLNHENKLVFKRLNYNPNEFFDIEREQCLEISCKTNRRLSTICYATELGDNVSASTTVSGSTQFVRDNCFLTLEEVAPLLENAIDEVGGLTINQFSCSWRGNYLLEIGDKISLMGKDGELVYSYLLDDTISYDGALSQESQWNYTDNDAETASNYVSLGDALKQTYAKVNKADKEIELLVSETNNNSTRISQIEMTTGEIQSSVKEIEKYTSESIDGINEELNELRKEVSLKISAEDLKIEVEKALNEGTISSVTTTTGFTFNEDGMTVSKTGSEMSTLITEDGMRVLKNGDTVLTADNEGVNARNLHATTYLIIGNNSRFEDYQSTRTGCFYIGGNLSGFNM